MTAPILHRAATASRDKSYAVDPYEWLNRPRSPFAAFMADLRANAEILVFGLTVGICVGALGTVLIAAVWVAAL